MDEFDTCRASYLISFLEVLRDIGTPVEREMNRAGLPVYVEETPDARVSNVLASKFLSTCQHLEGIQDLGWLGAARYSADTLGDDLRRALFAYPTVDAKLQRLAVLVALEHPLIRIRVRQKNGMASVTLKYSATSDLRGFEMFEWAQLMVVVQVVRSIAGADWAPSAVTFRSDFQVADEAQRAFPNTRFITRSRATSISFPSHVLAISAKSAVSSAAKDRPYSVCTHSLDAYEQILRPYLLDGPPKIAFFAEIVGRSPRTLQRQLASSGLNYSKLIENTRYKMAAAMLLDREIPVIEIALKVGYQDQSNFGRFFRRNAGLSPRKYRDVVRTEQLALASSAN